MQMVMPTLTQIYYTLVLNMNHTNKWRILLCIFCKCLVSLLCEAKA